MEIAKFLVQCNEKYDNPQTYRVDWAKSKAEKLFNIAKVLHSVGLHRGMTLALQSMNEPTLKSIKRKNLVDDSDMKRITKLYEDAGISTYVEIILGLPDETLESFKQGLCKILELGEHNYAGMYVLAALRNTPFGDKNYIKKHGIKTKRILAPIARWVEPPDKIHEEVDLVIEHNKLTTPEWVDMYLFSWLVSTCHHMGFTQYISRFLREHNDVEYEEFYKKLFRYAFDNPMSIIGQELIETKNHVTKIITEPKPRTLWGRTIKEFDNFQGEKEEVSALVFIKNKNKFYKEFSLFLKSNFDIDIQVLNSLINFQKINMVDPTNYYPMQTNTLYNFTEVIHNNKKLKLGDYKFELNANNYGGDYHQYGRELWYIRKSGAGKVNLTSYAK